MEILIGIAIVGAIIFARNVYVGQERFARVEAILNQNAEGKPVPVEVVVAFMHHILENPSQALVQNVVQALIRRGNINIV